MKFGRSVTPGKRLVLLFAVVLAACLPTASMATPGGASQTAQLPVAGESPFDRQGMWIWYVSASDGGSVPRIVTRARRYGIGTLYIKAGDAGGVWSQLSPSLIQALHKGGLDVCAWQFVYGDKPLAEARVGAAAVAKGADCLVIDAEGQYEGKYAAADRYLQSLRARIGPSFPLSLAAFPYVDYHPSFPYSVFFGPGGATYNQPQMYWKAIGTSVRGVYEHTYLFNRLWGHPIYPIGQTYDAPGRAQLVRFRRFAQSFGGQAPSWWDWQETSAPGWSALGATTVGPIVGYRPLVTHPILKRGSRGDLVVWAQEHLLGAGLIVPVTGIFGKQTYAAVRIFQSGHGLLSDGVIGTSTWQELLKVAPVRQPWSGSPTKATEGGAAAGRAIPPSRPPSASLPAKAYEIDPGPEP